LISVPHIQTKATFTTEVTPDKITLSILLSESDSKGKISVEELEKKMEEVLKTNGIDIGKQLALRDVSSSFQNYFLKKSDVQKAKYYNLEVYNAGVVGKLLRELAENQISNVRLVKAEYSKIEELKIELKGKAVAKAKRQAEEMTKAVNQKVWEAIFISDLETSYLTYLATNMMYKSQGENENVYRDGVDFEKEISFEKIKVDATVTVYFKIE
jgi:uncharacterized protein YggE